MGKVIVVVAEDQVVERSEGKERQGRSKEKNVHRIGEWKRKHPSVMGRMG